MTHPAPRTPHTFDVIVAGAGPAGAVAARTLAAAGIRTLLVDRAEFPRNKPCGGGVSLRALRRFPWLDAALAGVDVHRISRLHVEGPQGSSLDIESPDPCVLLVRRVEFDHALVRAAVAAGATLLERFEITQAEADADGVTLQARDGRRLRAPIVIAADGVHSVLAKRLGVNARWPIARTCSGSRTRTTASTVMPTCFPRRTMSTSGLAVCCRITKAKCLAGRTTCSKRSSTAWSAKACFTANRIAGTSRRF